MIQTLPGARVSAPARLDMDELLCAVAAADTRGEAPALRFLPELGLLVESVNAEARLTRQGVTALRGRLLTALVQQRHLAQRRRAGAFVPGIPAPVFVSGLPGSGAALLQNLLVEHPALDSPALWELLDPAAPAPRTAGRRALIGRARALAENSRLQTAGRAVGGLLEATRPGGCHRLLGNAFQSPMFTLSLHIPRYAQWLETQDLTAAYAFHREQLEAIAARIPAGTLVLRDPFHAAYADGLLRVYPDARIIRVHRDPVEVVATTAGLSATLRRAHAEAGSPQETGREWADRVERHLVRADRARRAVPEGRLLDVRHGDLVADPAGVVGRVLEFLGVEPVPAVLRNVGELAGRAAAAAGGGRRFRPAESGLSAEVLRRRFAGHRASCQG